MKKIIRNLILFLLLIIGRFNLLIAADQGYLGISIKDFSQTLLDNQINGVQIINVFDDGAAKNSNLKENDILTQINGISIANTKTLTGTLEKLFWGDEITITYWREGSFYNEKIVLGAKKVVKTYNVTKKINTNEEIWIFKDDQTELTLNTEGKPVKISKTNKNQTVETIELVGEEPLTNMPQYFLDINDKMQAINSIKAKQIEKGTTQLNEIIYIKTVTNPTQTNTTIIPFELNTTLFSVAPNPTIDGIFNLKFKIEDKSPVKIQIFDVTGKQLYLNNLLDFDGYFNEKIDLGRNIAKGTYLIQLQQNGKRINQKLIIQ